MAGQNHVVIFQLVEPFQECFLLFRGLLGCLVHRVGGGVAVGNHQSALLIPPAPDLFIGGKPVHRKKGGGGVGVYVLRMGAEFAAQVHPDQRGAGLPVLGKYQFFKGSIVFFQTVGQKPELGGFSGAVGSFYYDQFAHFPDPSMKN